MDIEAAVITKVIREGCMEESIDLQIAPELFYTYKAVWEYTRATFLQHGAAPPMEVVSSKFSFTEEVVDTSLSFLVDELRKKWLHNVLTSSLRNQAKLLESMNPSAALEVVRKTLAEADQRYRPAKDLNLAEDPERRLQEYRDRLESGGFMGLPTPWPYFNELTLGFHPEQLIMFAGRSKVGKCLEENSRIVDPYTGIEITLKDVYHSTQLSVLTWDGADIQPAGIETKIDSGHRRCLEVKLRTGRRICVSSEHPFLTPNGWEEACDIHPGSVVGLPRGIPGPMRPVELPVLEVQALALLLSEGSYTGNHIGFSNASKYVIDLGGRIARHFKADIVPQGNYGYDFTTKGGKSNGGHIPNPFFELLKKHKMERCLAIEKVIPDSVYSLPDDLLAEFLALFWRCDGYIERGAPCITLGSKRMVEQLQHLLLRFNIQSSILHKLISGGKYQAWRLRVYTESWERFAGSVPLGGRKGSRLRKAIRRKRMRKSNVGHVKLTQLPGIFWDSVLAVSDAGFRKVYDLSVPPSQCFVANDVLVHNSWSETVLACYHWSKGYKPLLFSREMSVVEFVRRIDAAHAQISHLRLRAGMLTTEEVDKWRTALQNMEGGLPFWVSGDDDGATGISGIAAKIQRYRPDIVYIDGGYLIEDESGGDSGWARWSNVCRDLKRLSRQEKLPIVISHQFSKEGLEDKGTEDTLKYGDVSMWFDLIVGLYQGEDLKLNKEMLIKVLKQREGGEGVFVTGWDLDEMVFDEKASGRDDIGVPDLPDDLDKPLKY